MIKAFIKWMKHYPLEPSEQRILDNASENIKAGAITFAFLLMMLLLADTCNWTASVVK